MADINTTQCTTNSTGSVNFNSNTPSIGQVWLTSNIPNALEKIQCVTITILTDEPTAGRYLISGYTDCYDCQVSNYFVYSFEDCVRKAFTFEVTAESFGFSPTIDETYYFTYSVCDELITTCATLVGLSNYKSQESLNTAVTDCKIGVVQETPVLQTGRNACTSCLTGNSVPHNVIRCTDGETDCVLLLANAFDEHLISYSDGIDQYCGVVVEPTGCSGPYFNFIQDYGVVIESGGEAECPDCLSDSAQKIKLVNCLDSEITEVVWSSAFYGAGDVSNLSLDNGCYEVSGYTEEGVTIDYFFNFEPQPGCDPCVECNGVVYDYILCNDEVEVNYQLRSFQSLSADTVFYNPLLDGCAKIVGTAPSAYTGTVYSVETFEDCSDCNGTADINYFQISICTTDGTFSNLYVTTDSTVTTGDIVKLMWGSNEWICGEIIDTASSNNEETYYNTQKNGSGETLRYDTCETCNSQGAIGITLLSCDIPYTESFVQITLENYLQILNYGSLQNYSVSDQNGNCYTISNVCPIPLNSNEFTPVGFYFNCSICSENNPDVNPPRSANTEYNTCVICCDCGSTATTVNSVTTPHPIYTDGFGTPVTQLNMVVLGGINGLNS
jgi:hypothetical protein